MAFSFKAVAKALGAVVDAVVPVGVGSRTKFAVLACPVLQVGRVFVPAPYQVLVDAASHAFCAAAPAFALAGVVRDL